MSDFGKIGEDIATKLLIEKGFKIIERNYHFGHGEIDIVAEDNNILVFVEVKTRSSLDFGEPEYAINLKKQKQLRKLAELYLYDKEIKDQDCRFDVVAIVLQKSSDPTVNHIENAF